MNTKKLTRKQERERVRKRGPAFLKKGLEIGTLGKTVAGAFYYNKTHHCWKVAFSTPPNHDLPGLDALVSFMAIVRYLTQY